MFRVARGLSKDYLSIVEAIVYMKPLKMGVYHSDTLQFYLGNIFSHATCLDLLLRAKFDGIL